MKKCNRCGYEWNGITMNPIRCPHCKSTRWNVPVKYNRCARCDTQWEQRGSSTPRYCPECHSDLWNIPADTFICPKCGKERKLRSNSRKGLCPDCDRYRSNKWEKKYKEGIKVLSSKGKTDFVLWNDGKGHILRYLADTDGMAYLWDDGKIIGSVNFNCWCRSRGLTADSFIWKLSEERIQYELGILANEILASSDDYMHKADILMELHGMNRIEAEAYSLKESGMDAMPIALKLGIVYADVVSALSTASSKVNMTYEKGSNLRMDAVVKAYSAYKEGKMETVPVREFKAK